MLVLLVEDDLDVRGAVALGLREAGHRVVECGNAEGALARVTEVGAAPVDLMITDVRLPRGDGLALFREVRRLAPGVAAVIMTSFGAVDDAVRALKEGAADYLTKPFDVEELVIRVAAIDRARGLESEVRAARAAQVSGDAVMIGQSPAMKRLFERLDAAASSDLPVLVSGPSGTGKELVARRLHARSGRASGPFVALNCAALPDTLLEAELFGHERGAFTGAVKRREGRFKQADGGTLFLDEVAEMSVASQAKLLRAVEEGVIEPLGTNRSVRVQVRLVAATNRDLKRAMAEGRFREDLYYRLNVLGIQVPALRERQGDLPLLLRFYLARGVASGQPLREVTSRAMRALSAYPFPGNVRELAHAVEHALLLVGPDPRAAIDLVHLPDDVAAASSSSVVGVAGATAGAELETLATALDRAEREHLRKALEASGGRRARAAELLGIARKTLWEKLRAHGLAGRDPDEADKPGT